MFTLSSSTNVKYEETGAYPVSITKSKIIIIILHAVMSRYPTWVNFFLKQNQKFAITILFFPNSSVLRYVSPNSSVIISTPSQFHLYALFLL